MTCPNVSSRMKATICLFMLVFCLSGSASPKECDLSELFKAHDTLFVAGQPDVLDPQDPYAGFEGRKGALLAAVSAQQGKKLLEKKLAAPPVFDGMMRPSPDCS